MILPQKIITLNLLRSSRCNPSLSDNVAIFGNFDFNVTPLSPPDTKVLIHNKPANRKMFGPHGLVGCYIGPSPNYYRYYTCIVSSTGGVRDAATVYFPQLPPR